MLKNNLVVGLRSLLKNKFVSAINILGLTLGIAVCLLIAVYIKDELSYDKSFANSGQLYRVGINVLGNGEIETYPHVDIAVGEGMKNQFPEVKDYTRILKQRETFVKTGDKLFKERQLAFADGNFLDFFSMPLVIGNKATALKEPYSMVVTKEFAKKYFGETNAVGESLIIGSTPYKITGLMEAMPANMHFHFDALLSLSSFGVRPQTWSNVGFYTYLQLNKDANPASIEKKFPELVEKFVVPETARDMGVSLTEARKAVNTFKFFLQPVSDIHLRSDTKYELEANSDIKYVYIFSAMALFILLLACVNFINLSTASSIRRAREVGVRKVLGSAKKQLVTQFLVESLLITLFSLVIALAMTYFLLPFLNDLSGKTISFTQFLSPTAIALELLAVLLIGMAAGMYPAFFISSFKVSKIFSGNSSTTTGSKSPVRSTLVVFQFAISTALIIATLIIYQQLRFMQDKKLGYNKEQLVYLQDAQLLGDKAAQEAFRQSLLSDNRVSSVSIGTDIPGKFDTDGTQAYGKDKIGNENNSEIHINIYHVDYDYVSTLGLSMLKGRTFSRDFPTDSFSVVINEAAVRDFGWTNNNPIGKTIVCSGQKEFKVIGVMKDFHYASVKQKVAPLVLELGTGYRTGYIVKVNTGNARSVIDMLQGKWSEFNRDAPFAYNFLDEQFAALYQQEQRTAKLFIVFATIAILIACMGLFGLATYVTQQRSKELSVRKVFGASVPDLVFLVSKDFLKLVTISCAIAIPIAWWGMHHWLQDFAYRIHVQWWMFALAMLATIFLAIITISFQSIKTALVNPIKNLRNQ